MAAVSVENKMQRLQQLNATLQNELDEVLDFETRLEKQRQHHLNEIHEERERKRLERIF